ncbi:Lysosome membrane protein 2 [Orchesella cincta]|uniref:Lysosome membrane protein 2 n=1 Tax=Orchesella cincta TaxID=48709 RepID=A0A1D2MR98_ORCCI|nr:Lysosome membrane protein 2 [Orchesella cincta]
MQKLPYILLGTGFFFLAVSLASWYLGPVIFGQPQQGGNNAEGQPTFNPSQFKTENYLKVYFFNVTNPTEVIAGQKPVLQEVGPYVYQEDSSRVMSSFDAEIGAVSYRDVEAFYFRPDLSDELREDDVVTIINMPYVGLVQEVSKLSSLSRVLIKGVITRFNEGLFLTKTVNELLFGGFRHELLASLSSITGEKYVPNNTFGIFYGRNNSNYGEFSVSMGLKNKGDLGKIVAWNNTSELEWWKDKKCRKLEGSYDGSLFPPGITQQTILRIFHPALCRTFKYGFKEEVVVRGIPGYRFTLLPSELADPRIRAENMCYCTNPGENNENCPKDGSYQLNACSKGASVSLSLPHFLYGSEEYLNQVTGYHPDESLHLSHVDIEPNTGLLLKLSRRVQVNLHLRPLRLFSDFRKVSNMLFPSIWTENTKEIPAPMAAGFMQKMYSAYIQIMLPTVVAGIALLIGLILVILALIILVIRVRKEKTKYAT